MKKINNKGFSKVEFMTMFAVIAILTAIGVKLVSDNSKNYGAFKNLANNFANSVAKYKDRYPSVDNTYNLNEVVEKGFSGDLKNPINTSESCDRFESFVKIEQTNSKEVTLLCGNYYVEGVQGQGYKVYEISEWTTEKQPNSNDNDHLYNFSVDGVEMLDDYYTNKTFVEKYYEKTGQEINFPYEVNQMEGQKLLFRNVYRTKTLVKELK